MPSHQLVALGDVCTQDRTIAKAADQRPVLGLDQIDSEDGTIHAAQGSKAAGGEGTYFVYDERHVLLSKLRPYLNKVGKPTSSGRCSTELVPLLPNTNIVREYLFYLMRSPHMLEAAIASSTGARMPRANVDVMLREKIALPPLDDQQRIVDILDRAASIQRLRQAADEKLKQIIPALFVDMFGDPASNPKGYEKATIGDHFLVKGGKRLPKGSEYSDVPTAHRYLRGTDIKANQIEASNIRYISAEIQQVIKRYIVQPDDTVITIAGTIGVAAPVTKDLVGVNLTENAAMLRAKAQKRTTSTYLSAFLNSPPAQSQIETLTGRVTIGKLALERIEKIELLLPPFDEQLEFERKLKDLRSIQRLSNKATETALLTANAASAAFFSV